MRGFRLEVRGFGPVVVHSSLLVSPGSLLACFGPSGSGKSLVSRLVYALASLPLRLVSGDWGEAVRCALYEVFGDYWETLSVEALVAVKGVESSPYVRGGEVNASFDKRVVGVSWGVTRGLRPLRLGVGSLGSLGSTGVSTSV